MEIDSEGRAGAKERKDSGDSSNRREQYREDQISPLSERRGKSRRARPSPRGEHLPTGPARAYSRARNPDPLPPGDAHTPRPVGRRPGWRWSRSEPATYGPGL